MTHFSHHLVANYAQTAPFELDLGFVGLDFFASGGEVLGDGVAGQGAESGDDALGVEDGAGHVGVGVGVAEEGFDGSFAELVVFAGDDLVEVDEGDMLLLGGSLGPSAEGAGLANGLAVLPDLAGDEGAEDRGGSLGFDVGGVLAHVPAEGVDGFGLAVTVEVAS